MPTKSGGSHALASFVSILMGGVLESYLSIHAPVVHGITEKFGSFLIEQTGLPVTERIAGILLITIILSFIWGFFYHIGRHGGK